MPPAIMGLGPAEILLLVLVILVVFGAGKIPGIGSSLGKGLKNFRKALKGEEEPNDEEESRGPKNPPKN